MAFLFVNVVTCRVALDKIGISARRLRWGRTIRYSELQPIQELVFGNGIALTSQDGRLITMNRGWFTNRSRQEFDAAWKQFAPPEMVLSFETRIKKTASSDANK